MPGSCVITVDVTSTQQGNLINTIPVGALTTNEDPPNTTSASATLTVRSMANLSLNKLMNPNTFYSGGISTLEIRITNNDNTVALTGVDVSDIFPPELTIATPSNLDATDADCGGPTVTATPGTSQLDIIGASIPTNRTCTIYVDVTQSVIGSFTNDIPADDLTSDQGLTNQRAFINYSVQANILNVSKRFNLNRLDSGQTTDLRIRLENPTDVVAMAIGVVDNLPAGVVVANPANISLNAANCGASMVVTAVPGSGTITINGGEVPGTTTCDVHVDVTSTTYGVFVNS